VEARYSLAELKSLVESGGFKVTQVALQTALALGFDEDDIKECIVESLEATHFYKTMPSEKVPGCWQDVYKITYRATRMYVKLQIGHGGEAIIISFKADESW